MGVPGFAGFILALDPEPQPEMAIRPVARNKIRNPEHMRCKSLHDLRRRENAKEQIPAQTIPCSDPVILCISMALEGAVVATVNVVVAAPLAGVTAGGANVQVDSLGRVLHENFIVPL